jgi:mannose-6-phosphate isomerase-like protein (cupin superfamily)
MNNARLEDMLKGWFVGNFEPSAYKSNDCEVAVKSYQAGDKEPLHHHKISTEITLILSGEVLMVGKKWRSGDIVVLSPDESTDFEAISDCITVVVKTPSAKNDKYLGSADSEFPQYI